MANWYVRDGAAGTNNGTNWMNAWEDMDDIAWASVTRGDTIYVADGNYAIPTLTKAESGSSIIEIRKACTTGTGDGAHGTETGWVDTYGDGTANWPACQEWLFYTGYWTINGVFRDESNWYDDTAYGFRFVKTSAGQRQFNVPYPETAHHLTFKYLYTAGVLSGEEGGVTYYCAGYSNYCTISHCFSTLGGRCSMLWNTSSYTLVEYTLMSRCRSTVLTHGELISNTVINYFTVRYNIFEDSQGTGFVMFGDNSSLPYGGTGHEFYGNLFIRTSGYPNPGQYEVGDNEEVIGTWSDVGNYTENSKVYNNTFINIVKSNAAIFFGDGSSGNLAYNNLFYGLGTNLFSGCTHNYNAFDGTNAQGEANAQTGITTAKFVNYNAGGIPAGGDFHLASATDAGYDTGSDVPENDVDMDGVTRGADAVWDRGAYEYGVGDPDKLVLILK